MALQFTTDIQTRDGFTVANAYGRVAVGDSYTGTEVSGHVDIYVTSQAFEDGVRPVKTAFIQDSIVPYNRDTDGTDILNIAHDALIAQLAIQGIVATKVL